MFISHQWSSKHFVEATASLLERKGISTWVDKQQIMPGDSLNREIACGIEGCRVVLVVLSQKYLSSESCFRELTLAAQYHKPIIAIQEEGVQWGKKWPPPTTVGDYAGDAAMILAPLAYLGVEAGAPCAPEAELLEALAKKGVVGTSSDSQGGNKQSTWLSALASDKPVAVVQPAILLDGPTPLFQWDFTLQKPRVPLQGNTEGAATLGNGSLTLRQGRAVFISPMLPVDIKTKSLEAVVRLSSTSQSAGAAISICSGDTFDAIVYGERQPGMWMIGSDHYCRTMDLEKGCEGSEEVVHLMAVYAADNSIAFYVNGVLCGEYTPESELQTFPAGSSYISIGNRLPLAVDDSLQGEVFYAALYDKALSASVVAQRLQRFR